MSELIICKENKEDFLETEHMVMRAFWNMKNPGCNEHLMVHKLRDDESYLTELSRVAKLDGKIVGVIMYSKATIRDDENDIIHDVITFGPLCVDPLAQSKGVGKALLQETIKLAGEASYPGIVIFGEPDYYPRHGFVTCDKYGITDCNGQNFNSFMCMELKEGAFDKIKGKFYEAEVFEHCNNEEELVELEKNFPFYPKLRLSCQWLHKQRIGRISQIQKNTFIINYWEKEVPAKLSGAFYNEELDIPVVGDYVTFDYNPYGDSRIVTVCERKSVLTRPDQSGHAISFVKNMKEQVMVANFDYVLITVSLNENYNLNRIARYVSVTLKGNGIPVVVLTKADLCNDTRKYVEEIKALSDKVMVHVVSSLMGTGLDEVREYMKPGVTIALLGSSGVGKSTLLNALTGEELMKTGEIREKDARGKHTTTYRQLFTFENGVTIIDTPGMRELGMCDVEEEIEDVFSDITELIAKCKFRDCSHKSEPGCAIKKAIEEGYLTNKRYELYKNLQNESKRNADMKAIAKKRKMLNKKR